MKPYNYINCILQTIINDCYSDEIEYYVFDNDARWDDSPDIFGPDATNRGSYGNLRPGKYSVGQMYYDYYNKCWRDGKDISPIYPSIIDHSFEPIHYEMDITLWNRSYKKYHPWPADCLTIKDLPLIVLHSEYGSKDIKKLNNMGYLDVHWFAHAYLCSEFYFKHYYKLEIVKNYRARPIKYPWICTNRLIDGPRKYRLDFLNCIDTSKGMYSLLNKDPYTNRTLEEIYPDNKVKSNSFDTHENHSAEIKIDELTPWNTSFLHVVSETVWQEKIHFTEKVFKPIVLHQPFVVLQAPGSLAYLRSYGFKTFGAWWDESYDTIEDPTERMQAIADIVNSIGAKSLEEIETMRMEMASVLEHNFRHFYENIPAICLDELRKGIANL